MKILIFFEHPDREYRVAVEMAKILQSAFGAEVVVASMLYHVHQEFDDTIRVLVVPSYKWRFLLYLKLHNKNLKIYSLNYEQMLSDFNKNMNRPKHDVVLNTLMHFSWSVDFTNYLISSGVCKNNIYQVPKYLYQLYLQKDQIDSFHKEALKEIKGYHRIIFIPLTDLQAFKSERRLEREFSSAEDLMQATNRRNYVYESLVEIFKIILLAAKLNNDYLFLIRPHPSVGMDQYRNFLNKNNLKLTNNISFDHSGDALQWALISDLILTNYSSVVLDAQVLGRNVALIEPYPLPSYLHMKWMDSIPVASNLSDLLVLLDHARKTQIDILAPISTEFNCGITQAAHYIGLNLKRSQEIAFPILKYRIFLPKTLYNIIYFSLYEFNRLTSLFLNSIARLFLYKYFRRLLRNGLVRDYNECTYFSDRK